MTFPGSPGRCSRWPGAVFTQKISPSESDPLTIPDADPDARPDQTGPVLNGHLAPAAGLLSGRK